MMEDCRLWIYKERWTSEDERRREEDEANRMMYLMTPSLLLHVRSRGWSRRRSAPCTRHLEWRGRGWSEGEGKGDWSREREPRQEGRGHRGVERIGERGREEGEKGRRLTE